MHLVWHRTELRLHDHPALHFAAQMAAAGGEKVVPLVIIDPIIFKRRSTTPRRQAWFLENVRALRENYRALGSDLIVREGEPHKVLAELAKLHKIKAVHFIKNYTPYAKERDGKATEVLEKAGVAVHYYRGQYTHEPGEVTTQSGDRFQVFTPYHRAWQALQKPQIFKAPSNLPAVPQNIARGDIPTVKSDIELPATGEEAAKRRLHSFLKNDEDDYADTRNRPDHEDATSRLSYYFNIGVLSHRLSFYEGNTAKWRSELVWWDFFADVLDRCPESAKQEYRADWRGFPWRYNDDETEQWKTGQTGYPMVDAGMRELQATGFMHNRVRMIAASFLTKHLLIDWRCGEDIFRGLLLEGDSSQNIGNWQWVAGCGVDAAPYFRVFNPVLQGQKFDPDGNYVRRWVPELADVPSKFIHEPWKLKSGDKPEGYPEPMIELQYGRDRFLETAKKHLTSKRPRND